MGVLDTISGRAAKRRRGRAARFFCGCIAAGAAALSGCTTGERSEAGLETVSIVIPYRAGGGFDRTVRLFAPFFERQLGGRVTVLPENAPGAGGRLGAAKVYRAPPDGSTLGIFNLPGFVLPEVLGENVDYDLRRLSWIGRIESEDYALLVAAESPMTGLDDIRAGGPITFLSTGYGSTILAASQIVAEQIGGAAAEAVFLTGYTGTAESLVALIRGDGNVAIAPIVSAAPYLESGDLRALAVTGTASPLRGVATFAELGYPELTPLNVQRSIAGPPGMDAALLDRLRAAFTAAVESPEFAEAASSAGMTLNPAGGDAVLADVEASFEYYERFKSDLGNPNASGRME